MKHRYYIRTGGIPSPARFACPLPYSLRNHSPLETTRIETLLQRGQTRLVISAGPRGWIREERIRNVETNPIIQFADPRGVSYPMLFVCGNFVPLLYHSRSTFSPVKLTLVDTTGLEHQGKYTTMYKQRKFVCHWYQNSMQGSPIANSMICLLVPNLVKPLMKQSC